EGARVRGKRRSGCAGARTGDIDAGTDAHLDVALDFERDERLAHRRPAHAELLRQVALGRQPLSRLVLALLDERRDLVCDLPVEAAVFNGLQRHFGKVVRPVDPSLSDTHMNRLQGKTALVTASGQGMGHAAVLAFAREGANVIATDVKAPLLEAFKGKPNIRTAPLDVLDDEAVAAFVEQTGPVDILF